MLIDAATACMALLVFAHVTFPQFERKAGRHADKWVPLTGGVAIGYAFLYLLPKLGDFTAAIAINGEGFGEIGDYRVYFYCLAGFVIYFSTDPLGDAEDAPPDNYRAHIFLAGFIIYNMSVGFAVATFPRDSIVGLLIGTAALLLHTLGINHQLRSLGQARFDRQLRWIFGIAVFVGWAGGMLVQVPRELVIFIMAFLSGGIITNVMFEEVPRKHAGRLPYFLFGIGLFVAVVVLMRALPKTAL